MRLNTRRLGAALYYSILLWIVGFVWGVVVFMVPWLKEIAPVPYVSKLPAVSFVLLPVYLLLVCAVTRRCLGSVDKKVIEGIKLGSVIFLSNLVLDAIVYFYLFNAGDYFSYVSIWIAYAIFLLLPWFVGRRLGSGAGS